MEYYKQDLSVSSITHKIVVNNRASKETDSRSFSISCFNIELIELFGDIKNFITISLESELKQNIVLDRPVVKTTHILTVIELNTKNSKSFSISAIHLSSLDLVVHLQKYLCHGKITRKFAEVKND